VGRDPETAPCARERAVSMEPISPELCLVDPVLARRARELLPPIEGWAPATRATAPASPAPRAHFTRLGAWLLVPSVVLNVALLWPKSPSEPGSAWAPAPVLDRSPPARKSPPAHKSPPADKSPPARRSPPARTSPPAGTRRTGPRKAAVLAAKAAPRRESARPPAAPHVVRGRRVLRWPATAGATSYDLVLWRGHRRVADLWPRVPSMTVASVACGTGRRLEKGRYLWFVYPVVAKGSGRYGRLAGWGSVELDPALCRKS
jgi:hypothetical protein